MKTSNLKKLNAVAQPHGGEVVMYSCFLEMHGRKAPGYLIRFEDGSYTDLIYASYDRSNAFTEFDAYEVAALNA